MLKSVIYKCSFHCPQAAIKLWEIYQSNSICHERLTSAQKDELQHRTEAELLLKLENQSWDRLTVKDGCRYCGHTVKTTKAFKAGEWVCDYSGKILEGEEVVKFLKKSELEDLVTEYCFQFIVSVSCNEEDPVSSTFGRSINHSQKHLNVKRFKENFVCWT